MGITALALYHRLPFFLRSLAANWRGRQLYSWRYDSRTDLLAEEALERDTWTADQWKCWREETLARVLHRAETRVPFYREHWTERRRRGDMSPSDILENWPVLDKESLRTNPRSFIADDARPRKMLHLHTSGTTGKPLELWQNRDLVRSWYALFEARWRRWYGVTRHDRFAMLGGQLVTPVAQQTPPFWVWNNSLNQLYCSSYHLAPHLIHHYLDALVRYRVVYLWGYTSSLYLLAEAALRLRRTDLKMKVVVLNAEPVYDYQRALIAEAFQCPVRETYGMTEKVAAASECQSGNLHLWPEAGIIAVLDSGHCAAAGDSDELVVTGLLQEDMPLIRYSIGDRGRLAPAESVCPCGRTLPMIGSIDGRSDDILYTPDGRRVGRLDPVFKADIPVREVQIVQEHLDQIRVLVVPAEGFGQDSQSLICSRLRDRLGDVRVEIERVAQIQRGANGKFRAVICRLPASERAALQQQSAPPAAGPAILK